MGEEDSIAEPTPGTVYVVVQYLLDANDVAEQCSGPLAVYSTRAKAESWIYYQDSGPVSFDIEEHVLDAHPDPRA